MITTFVYDDRQMTYAFFPSSTHIRSWSFPWWKSTQISNPEPLYFLSFQRRTSYLSRTTGIQYTCSIQTDSTFYLYHFLQFAYHEATFFLTRLLQQFTGFALDKSENLQTPAKWTSCDGLKGTEKVYPASHLTLYVKVSVLFCRTRGFERVSLIFFLGRALGTDGAFEVLGGMSAFWGPSIHI